MQISVLQHLIFDRNFQEANARQVYQDAIDLYHRLRTIIDYRTFDTIPDHVLSSLIIIIRGNLELKESFK